MKTSRVGEGQGEAWAPAGGKDRSHRSMMSAARRLPTKGREITQGKGQSK